MLRWLHGFWNELVLDFWQRQADPPETLPRWRLWVNDWLDERERRERAEHGEPWYVERNKRIVRELEEMWGEAEFERRRDLMIEKLNSASGRLGKLCAISQLVNTWTNELERNKRIRIPGKKKGEPFTIDEALTTDELEALATFCLKCPELEEELILEPEEAKLLVTAIREARFKAHDN